MGSKLIRKTDLKNVDDIEYRIEFNEIDLEEFKSYFNKKPGRLYMIFLRAKNPFMFAPFVVYFVMWKLEVLCAVLVIFFFIINVLSETET